VLEHFARLALEVLAEAHRGRGLERLLQPLLSLGERQAPQVLAGEKRRVEDEVHDLGVASGVEGVLQGLEARAAFAIQHDDLAIEPGRLEAKLRERGDKMRQLRAPVVA
jgi:hypothetical protein